MSDFLFFSSETTPPAGYILSKIYVPIEKEFNKLYGKKCYCNEINSIAIIPICMAKEWIDKSNIKERKYVSRKNHYADFRLYLNFEDMIQSDEQRKLQMFVENVKKSIDILCDRVKSFSKTEFLYDFDQAINNVVNDKLNQSDSAHSTYVDDRFLFIMKNCPSYIGGEDVEQSRILYHLLDKIPSNIVEEERVAQFEAKINETFHLNTSNYPHWLEYPNWPLMNDKPMRFIDQIETQSADGHYVEYRFEDIDTKIIQIIKQSI